jgi:hypothetical protein
MANVMGIEAGAGEIGRCGPYPVTGFLRNYRLNFRYSHNRLFEIAAFNALGLREDHVALSDSRIALPIKLGIWGMTALPIDPSLSIPLEIPSSFRISRKFPLLSSHLLSKLPKILLGVIRGFEVVGLLKIA